MRLSFCLRAGIIFSTIVIVLWVFRANADVPMLDSHAVKAGLTLAYTDNFDRKDAKDLGKGWSEAAQDGVVNEQISHHRLYFEIPRGQDNPWGSATLDLSDPSILGHGLHPGDYFEVTVRRLSREGSLGVELFDSDQLRAGSAIVRGESPLMAWNGTTWMPIAFDKKGAPVKFDWNGTHTIGIYFDSADGQHAVFSYYLDGHPFGYWTVNLPDTELDKIGVYAQSKAADASFEFRDVKVYTIPRA
jgi:hypothetical protein